MDYDTWYKIKINHDIVGGKGKFMLEINGPTGNPVTWELTTSSEPFTNAKWYQSDPWYQSIEPYADVKCLQITPETIAPTAKTCPG